jgi:hypothetical protein
LSEAQQLEFIEVIDTSRLPPNDIHTLEGDRPFAPRYRHLAGLVKGRRYLALQVKNRTVVFQFDDDEARTFTRIRFMLVEAEHITPPGICCK